MEEKYLLGQYYTSILVSDFTLAGVFHGGSEPGLLLDPACGDGVFLARALNYWRAFHGDDAVADCPGGVIYGCVEGVDIDEKAVRLSKKNISALIPEKYRGVVEPRVYHGDFFKLALTGRLKPAYQYILANPPYTRQEDMSFAFNQGYKNLLARVVSGVEDWSMRASLYAYFLVQAGRMLKPGGRLGFIVENSWINTEYGKPLRNWLFSKLEVKYVVESLVEKWFTDASVITNIIIAERTGKPTSTVRFAFLKKPLRDIVGRPPPPGDRTALREYYAGMQGVYARMDSCVPGASEYSICESSDMRVIAVSMSTARRIEGRLESLGVLRGSGRYLELIMDYVRGVDERIVPLGRVLEIRCGILSNADEVFYLPSKHWVYLGREGDYLVFGNRRAGTVRIHSMHIRRIIKPEHLADSPYRAVRVREQSQYNYVIWIPDARSVDPETARYVEWARRFIEEEYKVNKRMIAVHRRMTEDPVGWLRVRDTSGGLILLRHIIFKRFNAWLNALPEYQVDQDLYAGYLRSDYKGVSPYTVFAVVNSVLTYLGVELLGKSNKGSIINMHVVDYERIPVVNPKWLESRLRGSGLFTDFTRIVEEMLESKPDDIEREAGRPVRLEMEKYVLGSLGLSGEDIAGLYDALVDLVSLRVSRARRSSR